MSPKVEDESGWEPYHRDMPAFSEAALRALQAEVDLILPERTLSDLRRHAGERGEPAGIDMLGPQL